MSVYDAMADDFDRRRTLPDGVPETIRHTVLRAGLPPRPRLLDLGAGSGRIGWPFVAAGDDYTAADLSFAMLRAFANRCPGARLVQAEGARLPFADATFDAVLLVQVLSGVPGWRQLLADALRILRPGGALVVGRVVAPEDGVDARLKAHLATILAEMDTNPYRGTSRQDALAWLGQTLPDAAIVTVGTWIAQRTPRGFIERHGSGVRFSALPEAIRQAAMRQLITWATEQFGSIDAVCAEAFRFEMTIHRFQQGTTPACRTP
jgi:ubiquinone/menaquinone biosynthesis C-methylase UbiE